MTRHKPLKRTPFKPAKGKIWKTLQAISKSKERRVKLKIPTLVRKIVRERSQGQCEVYIWNSLGFRRCFNEAQDMHHRLPRGRGGKHTAENLMHICRAHHMICHANPARAREMGLMQ